MNYYIYIKTRIFEYFGQTDEHIAELKEGQSEVQPEGQIQL